MEGLHHQGDMPLQQEAANQRQLLRQLPNLQCPRCDSMDTKFMYFNNNKVSQERYLCRSCKRHWTHGGPLRNVRQGAAVQIEMPVMSTGSSGFRTGPHKFKRVNLGDINLFVFNHDGYPAGGSQAYNQGLRLHPAPQQAIIFGQLITSNSPSNPNISQAAAHNQGFRAHGDVQQVGNFDQLTGFNYPGSHVAGGFLRNISVGAANNQQGFSADPDVQQVVRYDQVTGGSPLWYPSGYNGPSRGHNGQTRNQNIAPDNHNQLCYTSRGTPSGPPSNSN